MFILVAAKENMIPQSTDAKTRRYLGTAPSADRFASSPAAGCRSLF